MATPAASEVNCPDRADEYEAQVMRTQLSAWTSHPMSIHRSTRTDDWVSDAVVARWRTNPGVEACVEALRDRGRRGGQERDLASTFPDYPIYAGPPPESGPMQLTIGMSRVGFSADCSYAWAEQRRYREPDWDVVDRYGCYRQAESGEWILVAEELRPGWN